MKFPIQAIKEYFSTRNIVYGIRYAMNWKNTRRVKTYVSPQLSVWLSQAENMDEFRQIINEIGTQGSNDFKALKCLKWVRNNITYKGDTEVWGVGEYWQSPIETVVKGTGDCEDGAILMYVLCRMVGIPKEQLKLFAGDVQGGGHCWLGYIPQEYPWLFTFMDWCYWYTGKTIKYRPHFFIRGHTIYGQDPRYIKTWFVFDESDSYYKLNEV